MRSPLFPYMEIAIFLSLSIFLVSIGTTDLVVTDLISYDFMTGLISSFYLRRIQHRIKLPPYVTLILYIRVTYIFIVAI